MLNATPLETALFLLFSSVWIIGFSIIVAALSYHHYMAGVKNVSFREQLSHVSFQRLLWSGLTLVNIGFAGSSNTTWQSITFAVLALLSGYQAIILIGEYRSQVN
ncbi:MAG: hypothetical protein AAGD96_18265 [Chloroflexota bacterium]